MKKNYVLIIVMLCSIFWLSGCSISNDVVRIHIRANSNSAIDQEVKLSVRDSVIDYITPLLTECNNSNDVKKILNENLNNIESIANKVLVSNGFEYISSTRIANEYFPSRCYEGEIYPADYYDALIIELGSGDGDNWWCVAYPPLCFVGEGNGNIQYKSKLLEMISNFFGE